jgi:hypothetical protein
MSARWCSRLLLGATDLGTLGPDLRASAEPHLLQASSSSDCATKQRSGELQRLMQKPPRPGASTP